MHRLEDIDDNNKASSNLIGSNNHTDIDTHEIDKYWKKEVEFEMKESFKQLHIGVLDVIKSYPTGAVMSKSGTTATSLFVTEKTIIVASGGDSRAVLSVATSFDMNKQASSI